MSGKRLGVLAVLCLGASILTGAALAASHTKGNDEARGAQGCPRMDESRGTFGWGGPGYGIDKLDRLADYLDLTEDQVAKLKEQAKQSKAAAQPYQDRLKADLKTLADKRRKGAADDELKAVLERVYDDQRALGDQRQKGLEGMRAVLTPSQQAKFILGMDRWKALAHRGPKHDGERGSRNHAGGQEGKDKRSAPPSEE